MGLACYPVKQTGAPCDPVQRVLTELRLERPPDRTQPAGPAML